ncbi:MULTISPECIES: DcrB-related protein, partial [unclassified Pseudomonas]
MHRPSIYDRLSQRREQQERLERERLEQEALKAVPPPRFFTNELSFVRPEALKDKTYQLLTLTDIGPSPFSLVIGRSQVSPDVDLEVLSQQLLKELEKSLAHLQWLEPLSA